MAAMGAPVVPEPRCFEALFKYLRTYASGENGLRMMVVPRSGPVVFYASGSHQNLTFTGKSNS